MVLTCTETSNMYFLSMVGLDSGSISSRAQFLKKSQIIEKPLSSSRKMKTNHFQVYEDC